MNNRLFSFAFVALGTLIGIVVTYAIKDRAAERPLEINHGDFSWLIREFAEPGTHVLMLSDANCSFCDQAKDFLRASEIPVKVLEYPQDAAMGRVYSRLGASGVPVLITHDGWTQGFSIEHWTTLLRLRESPPSERQP